MTADVANVPATALASGFAFTSIAPGAKVKAPLEDKVYSVGLFP